MARRLGFATPQGVAQLARRHADFPPPVLRLARGVGAAVWAWPDVSEWAVRTGRAFGVTPRP